MRDDVRELVENLNDPETRFSAVIQLGNSIGPAAAGAVPALIETFESCDDYRLRGNVFAAIGCIGPGAVAAVPWLIGLLESNDSLERSFAADTLRDIGPGAFAAVEPLVTVLLNDANEDVRESVAYALGAIGPAAADAVPALVGMMKRSQRSCQASGAALAKIQAT